MGSEASLDALLPVTSIGMQSDAADAPDSTGRRLLLPIRRITTTSATRISRTSSTSGCGGRSRASTRTCWAQCSRRRPTSWSPIRSATTARSRPSILRGWLRRRCSRRSARAHSDDYPITVFYAFKQAETDDDGDMRRQAGKRYLKGMLEAGWAVTATWPMRTERGGRSRDIDTNALASSIVLACRPRPTDAGRHRPAGLIAALREELPDALRKLAAGQRRAGGPAAGGDRAGDGGVLAVCAGESSRTARR